MVRWLIDKYLDRYLDKKINAQIDRYKSSKLIYDKYIQIKTNKQTDTIAIIQKATSKSISLPIT